MLMAHPQATQVAVVAHAEAQVVARGLGLAVCAAAAPPLVSGLEDFPVRRGGMIAPCAILDRRLTARVQLSRWMFLASIFPCTLERFELAAVRCRALVCLPGRGMMRLERALGEDGCSFASQPTYTGICQRLRIWRSWWLCVFRYLGDGGSGCQVGSLNYAGTTTMEAKDWFEIKCFEMEEEIRRRPQTTETRSSYRHLHVTYVVSRRRMIEGSPHPVLSGSIVHRVGDRASSRMG
ncbi:hypothetical protein B0T22DRAFT_473774, partial [Podospora appendiculata]